MAGPVKKPKGSKKGRKIGRNVRKPCHQRAVNEHRTAKHKEARLKKHLEANPNDAQSRSALKG